MKNIIHIIGTKLKIIVLTLPRIVLRSNTITLPNSSFRPRADMLLVV